MDNSKRIKVEIDSETLTRLLKNKQMFASEMRYLDIESKLLVKEICLNTCLLKGG